MYNTVLILAIIIIAIHLLHRYNKYEPNIDIIFRENHYYIIIWYNINGNPNKRTYKTLFKVKRNK